MNSETIQKPVATELLTVHEVAEVLLVDDTTVRRWIKLKLIEAITLPRTGDRESYRITRAALDAALSDVLNPGAHHG